MFAIVLSKLLRNLLLFAQENSPSPHLSWWRSISDGRNTGHDDGSNDLVRDICCHGGELRYDRGSRRASQLPKRRIAPDKVSQLRSFCSGSRASMAGMKLSESDTCDITERNEVEYNLDVNADKMLFYFLATACRSTAFDIVSNVLGGRQTMCEPTSRETIG